MTLLLLGLPLLLTISYATFDLKTAVLLTVLSFVSYQIVGAIYNIYFHPLSKFPGPKLWIAFPLFRSIADVRGVFNHEMYRLHEQYGEVVRHSDGELSFITYAAWRDAYSAKAGLPKWNFSSPDDTPDIVGSNTADHARFRKALTPGFSDRGMRDQEPLIRKHVDLLITKLRVRAETGQAANMTMWYGLTTFDLISDMAFGKAFKCLEAENYHPFISDLFNFVAAIPTAILMRSYPVIWGLAHGVFGKQLKRMQNYPRDVSRDIVLQRAADPRLQDRKDLAHYMLRNRGNVDKGGLTDNELGTNANILLIGGSETTATLLAGVTYYLLKTPHAMKRITREVRQAFESEDEITFLSAARELPYMLACLDEALRMYPPIPTLLSRITVQPTEVSGYTVPAGARVGVHQLAANWSSNNFHDALSYHPERWLPDAIEDPSSPFYNDQRDVRQPFGIGPRNCIGQSLAYNEMRLILAKVIWNFDLEMHNKELNWRDQKSAALWSKPELWCGLKTRT